MTAITVTIIASALVTGQAFSVKPTRGDRATSPSARALAALDRPSERTLETLKRHDLEKRYGRDVSSALASLEKIARARPAAEVVYALAELSWIEGKRLDRRRKADALDRYLDSVAYAYDFLFDPELADGRQPTDPRFRLACELYNGGLDRLIRAAQANGKIQPEGTVGLKVHGGEQILRVGLPNSPWKPTDIDQVILASDYEVLGLNTRSYAQYGLGVPLIGVRKTEQPGKPGPDRFYPPEMSFPLTAFLRPISKLRDSKVDGKDARECTLELVDPVRNHMVPTKPAVMPVEADLTTPLAYMWSRTDLNRYRWTGLLRPGDALERANLMLLRPYEPGKIPVVMVHGLVSSPLAWVPMLNELLRDPNIQDRYQFLLYMYPTGVAIPLAAAGLRDSLRELEGMYNPDGRDLAFNRMVLLGHSMGGLLSHAMAVDSQNHFWELNSDRPFEEILGPPKVLDELKRYMFFKALPFVSRVVFLATPHRGSDYSRRFVGRLGAGLISEPDQISELLAHLIKANDDAFDVKKFRRMPTSIETLDTDSEILMALLAMKPRKGVVFHSIIGSERPGPVAQSTDGVVPYRSAHVDGVASEVRVRSDHGVQQNSKAINEVHRILLEHLGFRTSRPVDEEITADAPATRR